MKKLLPFLLFSILLGLITHDLLAALRTTIAPGSVGVSGNWDCTCIPGSTDTVVINHAMTSVAGLTQYYDIRVNSGGNISTPAVGPPGGNLLRANGETVINSGGQITITRAVDSYLAFGDMIINSGGIYQSIGSDYIVSDFILDGTFQGNSTLYFLTAGRTIDGSGSITNTGTFRVNSNQTIASTADLTISAGSLLIVNNFMLTNEGSLTVSFLQFAGAAATYVNFDNSSLSITDSVDMSLGGFFYADSTGNTITYSKTGTDTQYVADVWDNQYYNLVIDGTSTSGAKVLQDDLEILGDLTINTNGHLSQDESYDISIAGDFYENGFLNVDQRTITFNGTGKQTIYSVDDEVDFYNLIDDNKFDTLEMDVDLVVVNELQLNANSKLDCNSNSIELSGDFIQNGEFIPREGYVQFVGSNSLSIRSINLPSINFYDVWFQASDTIELEIDANIENDMYVWFSDTLVTDENLNVGGNVNIFGRFDATGTSTLIMDGTGPQTISASSDSLNKFINSNTSDTVALVSDIVFKSTAAFAANSTFDVSSNNRTVTSLENFGNFGAFVHREGEVIMAGSGSQNLIGDYTFYDLTINNTSGATPAVRIISGKDSIRNALTLTEGQFETDDSLIFISDANGTAYIKEITGGSITGEIVYQNYINAGATNWRFMSSPVVGSDLEQWDDDFITSGIPGTDFPTWQDPADPWPSMYYYNESPAGPFSNGWTSPASTAVVIDTGQGYSVWCGDTITGTDPFTIDVRGEADTGDINMPVTYNFLDGSGNAGWNLVGNPYPSPIRWKDADWTKTNIDDAIYIWDPDAEQYASYVSGVGSNGGSDYIAPSQGFWIKANGSNPVLTAREGVKYDSSTVGFKSNAAAQVLRLKLTGNGHSDETVFRFEGDATAGFDSQYDAFKMYTYNWEAPSLASLIDTIDYSINTLPLEDDVSIPLLVYVGATQQYTFTVEGIAELGLNSCIVLEDRETGTFVDLKTTPTYTATIPHTIEAPRFYLHVSSPLETEVTGVSCFGLEDGKAIVHGTGVGPWDYTWYDQEDNVIDSAAGMQTADTLENLPAGLYRVLIGNGSGYCASNEATLEVEMPDPIAIETMTSAESCPEEADGWIEATVGGGTMPYTFLWNTGAQAQRLEELSGGNYQVAVTDANGCSKTVAVELPASEELISSFEMSAIEVEEEEKIVFENNSAGGEHWVWDFGDGNLSAEESPIYQYNYAGDYVVQLSVERGPCFAISKQKIKVYSPVTAVSVEYNSSVVKVDLYPNPATESDLVYLRMEELGAEEILVVVTDLLGRQWYSKVLITQGNGIVIEAIDVDGRLPAGTYMVTGSSKNELFSKKLVIQ